jgi:hypothetical protein
MAEEYQDFMQQSVRVVTLGRLTNESRYNTGNSLQLEGILDKETDTQVFLRNMHTFQESNKQLEIETPYGAVSKDQIISLYLTPKEKQG